MKLFPCLQQDSSVQADQTFNILSLSPAFWPPKGERLTAGTYEIASDNKKFPLAGIIPGLMVGSAYKGLLSYRRLAGLRTPSGPRLSPWA